MKENEMKQLAKELDRYHKENVCEYASSRCRTCTFSIDNNTGCALNLVINVLHDNLSIDKNEAYFQFKETNMKRL